MPRLPRLGRGEQDAPPEAHAAEQTRPDQQLSPGDPLAGAAPAPAGRDAAPASPDLTPGDPLAGAAPGPEAADERPPAAEPAAGEPAGASPAEGPGGDAALWTSGEEQGAPAAAPEPAPAAPEAPAAGSAAPDAPTTVVSAVSAWVSPAPAAPAAEGSTAPTGVPGQAAQRPEQSHPEEHVGPDSGVGFRERLRMRRRLRALRRLREIAYRDLGGLAFELHRFGRDRQDLVAEKLRSVEAIDAELRALETALAAATPLTELREAGIAACPRCETLHGSDANFCSGCGMPLTGRVGRAGPLRVPVYEQHPPQAS